MKKIKGITAVLMMGLVIFGANVAFSESAPATGAETTPEAGKPDANKNDLGARSDCAPTQDSSSMEKRDPAVGSDRPAIKDSQSKKDESAATAPCPPGQSAQPKDSINQGSTDKGGAGGSSAVPDTKVGPDNSMK